MKKRKIVINGGIASVPLTMGKTAKLDSDKVHLVDGYNWTCAKRAGGLFYAYRNECIDGKTVSVLMHRVIAGAQKGEVVDHIDGDGLNNRSSNIRICTHSENMRNRKKPKHNTSGHKGVKRTKSGKWEASIRKNRVYHYLGVFDDIEDAASAYADASAKLHVDFGRLC